MFPTDFKDFPTKNKRFISLLLINFVANYDKKPTLTNN